MAGSDPVPEDAAIADVVEDPELVLVVDDERDVAETTALMLEERGLDVAWDASPQEGLERLVERPAEIACVVSDYQMPRMDGLELLEAMREIDPNLPFLLFTGQGSERIASEAIKRGVSGYIQKGGLEQYDRVANRVKQALEQRRTRRELEETKARFDALTQNTSFTILTIDEESVIRYANDAVEDLFGYPSEALIGDPLAKLIPDRLVEAHHEGIHRYLQTDEAQLDWGWTELPAETRDGEEVSVGVSFGERKHDDGRLFTGILRDISERKAQRDALETQKDRFEAVFENALDSIFVLDPASKTIRRANPAASDLLGYDREELRGMDIEAIHPDDYADLLAFAQEVLTGEPGRYKTACHTAAGDVIPAEVAGSEMIVDGEPRLLAIVRPHED